MSPYTDRRMPPRQNPGQGNGISRMEEKRQLRRRVVRKEEGSPWRFLWPCSAFFPLSWAA